MDAATAFGKGRYDHLMLGVETVEFLIVIWVEGPCEGFLMVKGILNHMISSSSISHTLQLFLHLNNFEFKYNSSLAIRITVSNLNLRRNGKPGQRRPQLLLLPYLQAQ